MPCLMLNTSSMNPRQTYWQICRENRLDRHYLLCLLEKYRPYCIYCYYCNKPHKFDEHPHIRGECHVIHIAMKFPDIDHKDFKFTHVQMTMKLHGLSLDYSSAIGLQNRTRTKELRLIPTRTCPLIFDARVVSNELLVRSQDLIFLPARAASNDKKLKNS